MNDLLSRFLRPMPAAPARADEMGRVRHVHLVGIGGIGMSSIAEVLIRRGFQISGSDLRKSDVTAHLESLGATIHEGHAAEHVEVADVVVYSSAVKDPTANAETAEAIRRRIPIIKRAEMLGELMRAKRGVGVAGTHGKTTTTTLVGLVLQAAELDPTIIVGGKVAVFGSNAVAGIGEHVVVEADEYDRTFLRLAPIHAVVTNIEADHLDIYADLDDIRGAFTEFARRARYVVASADDAEAGALPFAVSSEVVRFSVAAPDAAPD
ncbi:MAG TPA: Mur ligase domain-containing protein, partial [Geminicoccaceae bacterium]